MEAGGVAPANGVIKHGFDVEERDSSNELIAEGLVGLLEEAVGFLLDKVLAIEFGDFSGTGASGGLKCPQNLSFPPLRTGTRTGTLKAGLRIEGGTGAGRTECPANNAPLVERPEEVLVLF